MHGCVCSATSTQLTHASMVCTKHTSMSTTAVVQLCAFGAPHACITSVMHSSACVPMHAHTHAYECRATPAPAARFYR